MDLITVLTIAAITIAMAPGGSLSGGSRGSTDIPRSRQTNEVPVEEDLIKEQRYTDKEWINKVLEWHKTINKYQDELNDHKSKIQKVEHFREFLLAKLDQTKRNKSMKALIEDNDYLKGAIATQNETNLIQHGIKYKETHREIAEFLETIGTRETNPHPIDDFTYFHLYYHPTTKVPYHQNYWPKSIISKIKEMLKNNIKYNQYVLVFKFKSGGIKASVEEDGRLTGLEEEALLEGVTNPVSISELTRGKNDKSITKNQQNSI